MGAEKLYSPNLAHGFNIGPYEGKTIEDDGLVISAYAYRDRGMKAVATDLMNAYRTYSHYFGDIQRSKFNAVMQAAWFNQSFPNLIYLDPATTYVSSSSKQANEIVLHEMAHQWFGHEISPAGPADTWLSEGFAEYASWLAVQMLDGDSERIEDIAHRARMVLSVPSSKLSNLSEAGPVSLGPRLHWINGHRDSRNAYQGIVYSKGAYTLHMLRMMLYDFTRPVPAGDAGFIAMMKSFVDENRGQRLSTEDFRRHVERHLGMDMQWFFDQWIHGTTLPKVKFENKVKKRDDGKYDVILRARIEEAPDGFRLIVPYVLEFEGGVFSGLLDARTGENEVIKVAPAKPKKVKIDPWKASLIQS